MNFPILSENKSNPSVRYRNYYYTQKTAGKVSAMFRCSTINCYASISLKVDRATQQIQRPIEVKTLMIITSKINFQKIFKKLLNSGWMPK